MSLVAHVVAFIPIALNSKAQVNAAALLKAQQDAQAGVPISLQALWSGAGGFALSCLLLLVFTTPQP